jgi:hypothetical protein
MDGVGAMDGVIAAGVMAVVTDTVELAMATVAVDIMADVRVTVASQDAQVMAVHGLHTAVG